MLLTIIHHWITHNYSTAAATSSARTYRTFKAAETPRLRDNTTITTAITILLYYIILYYVVLCYVMLYLIILCSMLCYSIMFYYIILYYIILYYTIQSGWNAAASRLTAGVAHGRSQAGSYRSNAVILYFLYWYYLL